MTLKELYGALKATKYPVAHYAFKSPTPAPFVVYLTPTRTGIAADNKQILHVQHIRVELYTKSKSQADEARLEAALDTLGVIYEVDETAIDSEGLYVCGYEFDIDLT